MGTVTMIDERRYPRRIVFDVSEEMYRWLKSATAEDDISTSHRLRGYIALAQSNASFHLDAATIAAELKSEDLTARRSNRESA